MQKSHRHLLLILVSIISISFMSPVVAGGNSYHHASSQQESISKQVAVATAQKHIKGRVLAINRINHNYRIKILSNQGTVHIVVIDHSTGEIISSH